MTSNGAGLGLAICKRILELHNSIMLVESTPGQGSRFSFVLPVALLQDAQLERVDDRELVSACDGLVSSPTASAFS